MRDPARDVLARRPRHGLIPVALGLLGLCASLGCGAKSAPKSARVPITVAIAVERPVPFAIAATGTVEAIRTAAIGSQVGGTVQRVAFREGDYVRAGQLLIQLDPRPFARVMEKAIPRDLEKLARSYEVIRKIDPSYEVHGGPVAVEENGLASGLRSPLSMG